MATKTTCEKKKNTTKQNVDTIGNDKVRKDIKNRLSRVIGTMNGIKKMVEEGVGCDEILVQLSAAVNATKSVANYLLLNHLQNYVANEVKNGNKEQAMKDVISYFKRFE